MLFFAVMAGYGLLYVLLFARLRKSWNTPGGRTVSGNRQEWIWAALGAGAFSFRLLAAPLVKGHPTDYNDFAAWSLHAYALGLPRFYQTGFFADYPPGYVYVLYVIGWVRHVLAIDLQSPAFVVLLKIPAMVADLAAGRLIYRLAMKRLGFHAALTLSALYLFNPVVFLNSALWAQVDSVYTFFILLTVAALTAKKLPAAGILFAVALLIKPQSVIFAPLLLFALVERRSWKTTIYTAMSGFAIFAALLIPFSLGRHPLWILGQYKAMFAMYPYASLNAFNAYALIGANWAPATGAWLHISYGVWDAATLVFTVTLAAWLFAARRDSAVIPFIALLITLLVFMFKAGMHERYGYPAVALALLAYICMKDRRMAAVFLLVTLTHFVNVVYVLGEGLHRHYVIAHNDSLLEVVSFANLVITGMVVFVGLSLLARGKLRYNGRKQKQTGIEGRSSGTVLLHTK
jgi:dolichyl-phosphate-mannose-protein mannosyltransferase